MERTDRSPVATFFASDPLVTGGTVILPEESAHHIHVARVAVGDCIALRDGAGKLATGTLVKVSRTSALVQVSETNEVSRPAPIHLLAPVADRDRMLWLAEKATELGVTSWRPVVWRRSRSVSPRGEGPTFQGKVRARMISALIQSGGGWLPDIFPEATIENAIAAAPAGTRVLLARDGQPMGRLRLKLPVTIALGPEGGMESAEKNAFIAAGYIPVKLGESTLRFETAGIAAVAIAVGSLALPRQSNG